MNSKYKELTDKAFACHQKGNFEMAEKIYKSLLNINPDDANLLNLLGMLMLMTSRVDDAINYLSQALIINNTSQIACNLAKAYYSADKPERAIKLYNEALRMEQNDDIFYSLGLAYKKTGDLKSAIEAYHNALEQNPGNYSACYNLSIAYSDIDDYENAIFYAKKCEILRDDDEYLYAMLSSFYEKTDKKEHAIEALEKASALSPDNFLYYYNIAVLSSDINNNEKAVYYYLKSLAANPNHIESYINLANIIKKNDSNAAIEYLLKAYQINPKEEYLVLSLAQTYKDSYKNQESIDILTKLLMDNPYCADAYSLIAINYMDLCLYDKALQNYDLALKLSPDNVNFIHGRAVALKYLGRMKECREILEKIVLRNDSTLESKITLGMIYLQDKQFKKGMDLYRLRAENINSSFIEHKDIWEPGDDIVDKTILVYSNCGLGDSIMYSRYLPELKDKSGKVVLQVDDTLVSIFQKSFPNIEVVKKTVPPPKFDKVMQFMDIQLAINKDFSEIPLSGGYLYADETLIKMFSELVEFKNSNKKKIGLFWQGNRKIFKNRSVKFDIISTLTENTNYNFYSFQPNIKINEKENFFDLSKHIKDYSDTAALLKLMDTIVTVDSSIAHMAGALGVNTYLLLPKTAEWRWFYDEEKTPWYESVRIFKQKESANWLEVLDRVQTDL